MVETDSRLERVHRFFSGTGATYDAMVRVATLGIDRRWKQRMVDLIPANSTRVLDLACGTGISTLAIAARLPNCHVIGVELRDEYLSLAREKIRRLSRRNVELLLSRAEDYRSDEPFDCVASSYLAKYADLKRLTANTHTMLKPGGLLLMHDFTFPPRAYLVAMWRIYFWLMQRVAARMAPSWREIYYGLPRLIEEMHWLPELTDALEDNGFQGIRLQYLTLYGSAIMTATKAANASANLATPLPTASPPR